MRDHYVEQSIAGIRFPFSNSPFSVTFIRSHTTMLYLRSLPRGAHRAEHEYATLLRSRLKNIFQPTQKEIIIIIELQ